MSVNATIDVASVEKALTITSKAFLIKAENLQKAAGSLAYAIQPIEKNVKQQLIGQNSDKTIQFVWQVLKSSFKEIPVEVGATNDIFFEIKSGLSGDEKLVIDVVEDDEMQKIYDSISKRNY